MKITKKRILNENVFLQKESERMNKEVLRSLKKNGSKKNT